MNRINLSVVVTWERSDDLTDVLVPCAARFSGAGADVESNRIGDL